MTVLYERDGVRLVAEGQALRVSGAPDFDNASPLAAAGVKWLDEHQENVEFDASAIEQISSAMLSILLEWIRTAKRRELAVSSIKLSEGMREIVNLADLNEIFPA